MSSIAFFIPSLRGGGAERIMVTLANQFAAMGHRVDLVLVKAEGPYLSEVAPSVRIVNLDKKRALSSLLPLIRYLRRERPEAMLSALNHVNIVAILARKLARVKTRLVVAEHNAPSMSLKGGGMKAVMRQLIRRFYPAADDIVCVSEGMRREMIDLLSLSPDKLKTIYNPLDVDVINERVKERPDHPWLGENNVPVVLSVGRLVPQKDFPTLLKAFALLRRKRPCRLVILGEGSERALLQELAQELGICSDFAMLGFQSNPFGWMASSDLYVMSSAWEGLPGVLLEALASGMKVVSTNCPTGPYEILDGGKWGRLVPVGDAEMLALVMSEALDDVVSPAVSAWIDTFRPQYAISSYAAVLQVEKV